MFTSGTIAEAKKNADRENKKILTEEKRKQQAEELKEMSTDTNGRHKRVKKRKVDKEFSYEESDSKSSAYVDGDQEITGKNKKTRKNKTN